MEKAFWTSNPSPSISLRRQQPISQMHWVLYSHCRINSYIPEQSQKVSQAAARWLRSRVITDNVTILHQYNHFPVLVDGIVLKLKVRQHPSGAVSLSSRFFFTIYDISNVYFNLISLNKQIKILFNGIKHYITAKRYT